MLRLRLATTVTNDVPLLSFYRILLVYDLHGVLPRWIWCSSVSTFIYCLITAVINNASFLSSIEYCLCVIFFVCFLNKHKLMRMLIHWLFRLQQLRGFLAVFFRSYVESCSLLDLLVTTCYSAYTALFYIQAVQF